MTYQDKCFKIKYPMEWECHPNFSRCIFMRVYRLMIVGKTYFSNQMTRERWMAFFEDHTILCDASQIPLVSDKEVESSEFQFIVCLQLC